MTDRIWDGMTNQQIMDWQRGLDQEQRQKLEAHLSKQELRELAERVGLGSLEKAAQFRRRWHEELENQWDRHLSRDGADT